MGVRFLFVGTIPLCLVTAVDGAHAQSASRDSEVLPAIEVVAPTTTVARPARNRAAPQAPRNVRRVLVYPTAPTPTVRSGMDVDKVPAAINAVGAGQIARTGSLNIGDALQQQVPGIILSDTTGNPFMPDIQFRGFTASPVAGTPQGLAVYQNGMRINEAFGDTVNWDLIPTAAIRSVTVVTNNPAFGLNALGGAVNVLMKDGFSYQGAETNVMGGSFGRIQGSAQAGKQVGNYSVYGALEGVRDNGYRNFGESAVRRFYGDVGYRTDSSEFHLNVGLAKNNFGASAAVPIELLNKYWGATYTTPQTTDNRVAYANLTGKVEVTPTWTLDGSVRVRRFQQKTVDGNPTETEPCAAPNDAFLCFNDDTNFANGVNGVPIVNPFPADAVLGQIDRTTTRSTTTGATLQATNTDQLFGHNNQFMIGTSFDSGVTRFGASAELGTIGSDYVVNGSGIFLGPSGAPISIGPVSLRATNRYTGLYAIDTFDVTDRFSVSGGGRFNYASINLQDQIGTDLNGSHTFSRFNPMVGGTYKVTPEVTAYAGYSEANRAPTPLELACADPARPCIVAAFLIADPPLKQVVSRTIEAGFRGSKELNIGTLGWKIGGFRATNADDILAIPSPEVQGFGYFQNVGRTRRQGIEAQVNLTSKALQLYASYTLVDARFLDSLSLNSRSPFAVDDIIQVVPGNRIPSVPRNRVKLGVDYAVTDAFKVGGDALFVASQYFAGDESNQAARLPGYSVFNLHASYQINKTFQLYGRVDNVFDKRYATFGTFFERDDVPNFSNGGAEFSDPRTVTPARPRAFYAGLKATW
ncbi:TonB-dependent receptor [Bradyrhizobium roseum]|uniref:TonB-dependent receptor n=1 Tax=Bradyrhizobium roseum TaxID=3056648 RepID=UPI0026158B4B|nr:TonB-dependent receptor [Bradyrhizobium roseus]WKA31048.1 TonB-dependent receptor [Bradyrhizobium roseus]